MKTTESEPNQNEFDRLRENKRFMVGLGNPGSRYENTRHNVGFRVIDRLWRSYAEEPLQRRFCSEFRIGKKALSEVFMIKPLSYMNLSGSPVRDLMDHYGGEKRDLLVIHDDMDLQPGQIRFRRNGGSGGHKGVSSVIDAMLGEDFARLKIGIGRGFGKCQNEVQYDVVDFVLDSPEPEEYKILSAVEREAARAAWQWVSEPMESCMGTFNRKKEKTISSSCCEMDSQPNSFTQQKPFTQEDEN